MEEIKELLKEINNNLKYQTKLFEAMYGSADSNRFKMEQQKKRIEGMKETLLKNPMISKNLQAVELLDNLFSVGGL